MSHILSRTPGTQETLEFIQQVTYGDLECYVASLKLDRESQEDSAILFRSLDGIPIAIVCDGLGGHVFGEAASGECVDTIATWLSERPLTEATFQLEVQRAFTEASSNIGLHGDNRDTTCTLAAIFPDRIHIAHVGDSRATLLTRSGCIDTIHKTTAQGYGSWVSHTMATLEPTAIQYHAWPALNSFNLVLSTDGCEPVHLEHSATMRADRLCDKASLLGDRGSRDNATAISITKNFHSGE